MSNVLQVKCKTPGCLSWLKIAEGGLQRVGNSYSFPVLVSEWEQRLQCPDCGREHLYSYRDVRDSSGFPV